jgi:benzylsuccinate CoA-transferase BbsE subunit
VLELASESAAYCGKLLGDYGADVLLVEPPGGHYTRSFEPFVNDIPDVNMSLWFWHYNTSKSNLCLDLTEESDRETFHRLLNEADIVLEAEPIGRLASLGLDGPEIRRRRPELIWVSVTPFGRSTSRAREQAVDLTVLSSGGPVWSTGYDDHGLAPVRGGGNQGYQIASVWAAIASLTAVIARRKTGLGQLVDVSMNAAANVTTEQGSHYWLVAHDTVQRQTGRHARVHPSTPTIVKDRDGNEVHTGFPPHTTEGIGALLVWLEDLGIDEAEFGDIVILKLAIEELGGVDLSLLQHDPLIQEAYRACRAALVLIASRLPGYEFFVQGQTRGIPVGIVYSPEQIMADPHMVGREFPTSVYQDQLDREVSYPGAPARFMKSRWRISRSAPNVKKFNVQDV